MPGWRDPGYNGQGQGAGLWGHWNEGQETCLSLIICFNLLEPQMACLANWQMTPVLPSLLSPPSLFPASSFCWCAAPPTLQGHVKKRRGKVLLRHNGRSHGGTAEGTGRRQPLVETFLAWPLCPLAPWQAVASHVGWAAGDQPPHGSSPSPSGLSSASSTSWEPTLRPARRWPPEGQDKTPFPAIAAPAPAHTYGFPTPSPHLAPNRCHLVPGRPKQGPDRCP